MFLAVQVAVQDRVIWKRRIIAVGPYLMKKGKEGERKREMREDGERERDPNREWILKKVLALDGVNFYFKLHSSSWKAKETSII